MSLSSKSPGREELSRFTLLSVYPLWKLPGQIVVIRNASISLSEFFSLFVVSHMVAIKIQASAAVVCRQFEFESQKRAGNVPQASNSIYSTYPY